MAAQDRGRTSHFPCKQCGLVCPNMPSLLEHMDAHLLEEEERKFKCDECGRGYRHAGSLANHKKTHEVGSFQCDICGKDNSNALSLKSHLRSHTSQKKYSCVQCGKSFRLASQLTTHEKVHLTRRVKEQTFRKIDGEYPAHENSDLIEDDHLNEHLAGVGMSTEDSPFEDKAEDVYNAQAESSDEAADRPFKCDLCDKAYIHHRSLTNHKKTHQVGMFECTVCFKLFNNMAALYSHQRTHKSRSGTDPGPMGGSFTGTPLGRFSPQNQNQVNFCHLCQVLFPSDEEFQEHIQMHNSSSMTFGLQGPMSESHNISYDNSIASPESNFYASPINNIPSVSSVDHLGGLDPHQEQILSNGHVYSDCSNNQTPSSSSTQGEPPILDSSLLDPVLAHTQNNDMTAEFEETSTADSAERPFKCQICGKSYRHSGSLINHKRSHQVGIYQCSVCRKSYPHLAALKSHLRLHKGQSPSFSLNAEGDWLSSEPLTLENQQGCFSSHEEEDDTQPQLDIDPKEGLDHNNGSMYHEQFNQDFSQDMTVHLPHSEHLMQRHMCADCGETFSDIAGIKSHSCPLLQQQHDTTSSESNSNFQDSNGHYSVGNPVSNVGFHGLNGSHDDQSYFEQNFHQNMSSHPLNGDAEEDDADEEDEEEEEEEEEDDDDDGDLYECSICGNSYSSMRALRSHLRGHTQAHGTPASSGPSSMSSHEEVKDELGEMMICSTCGESFANRQDLVTHQLVHNKDQVDDGNHLHMNTSDVSGGAEEPQSIICGSCGIFCTSYHHLESHGCTPQRADESANCKEEMKVNDAAQHEDTSHVKETCATEARQYKCDQCGRSYRHAGSLLNHKKSHKTGVFRCLVCQKRFYNLLALKNHQRSHFDIKRHTCNECGKAFKIQKQLLNHQRRHKENQAKIQELNSQIQALMQMNGTRPDGGMQPLTSNSNQASTSARRSRRLPAGGPAPTKHETPVKSEETGDPRPFACDQCGRTYRHAGSLVNHRNSHKTGEYYCSVCNNSYSNQLAMKNHLRTHFAFKKHSCQNCGKGFRGKKQLSAHVCVALRNEGARTRRGLKPRAIKCKECKQAFPSVDQLAAHTCDGPSGSTDAQKNIFPRKEERPFTCNICNRSYRHAGSLLNHKNTHKTGTFSCTVCSKPFTNPMALRNHTRIHTQKKKYVCLTCGKAFRLASILHNHQRVHNRMASHFSCTACGKSFQGRSGLKRHRCRRGQGSSIRAGVQQSERGDKCFTCDLCGRSYRHAGSLLNHKKTHSENLHHCTLCLQTFPDSLTLQIHSQMRRHCCPECGKTFCLVAHLQNHMEVHAKERAVVCNLCQQSFPTTDSYQQHHDMHHRDQGPYQQAAEEPIANNFCWDSGINPTLGIDGLHKPVPPPLSHIPGSLPESPSDTAGTEEKSHVCEHCGRTYRHAGSLLNHKNSHKTGSFFCSICQKEFTNLMALKNHRRIHTEPKRYQCLDCGKAFRVSTQLICHRRIHTKEKPFACLLCDKSFSSKSNLRHHQKMHQNTQGYDSSFSMEADTFMDLDMGSFL